MMSGLRFCAPRLRGDSGRAHKFPGKLEKAVTVWVCTRNQHQNSRSFFSFSIPLPPMRRPTQRELPRQQRSPPIRGPPAENPSLPIWGKENPLRKKRSPKKWRAVPMHDQRRGSRTGSKYCSLMKRGKRCENSLRRRESASAASAQ